MKKRNFAMLFIALPLALSGCKTTPTPYEVQRSVDYKKGRAGDYYDFGVTEEKVNDRIYFVTVKLAGTSTQQRAKDMWYLHAANLTLKNNFKIFSTDKRASGRWCKTLSNRYTGQKQVDDAGPRARGFVLMANSKEELPSKSRTHQAKVVKKNTEPKINKFTDEATMLENEERYLKACAGIR